MLQTRGEEDKLGQSALNLWNLFESDLTALANIQLRYEPVDQSEQCQEVSRLLISCFKAQNLTEDLYEPCADHGVPPADIALWSALEHQELGLARYLDVRRALSGSEGGICSTGSFHDLPIVSLKSNVHGGEV